MGRLPLLLCTALLLLSCAPAPSSPDPTEPAPSTASSTAVPSPTLTPSPAPTFRPTSTRIPTRTPRPSPTLPASPEMACIPLDGERMSGVVSRVIDGDTIDVQVGARKYTIRYLGMNTPETYPEPQRLGPEASDRNRELVSGKRVTLVSDPEADDTDIYGRLLRFVLVEDTFVNWQLVREGLARYYPGGNSCGPDIFQAEQDARTGLVGLWAPTPTP